MKKQIKIKIAFVLIVLFVVVLVIVGVALENTKNINAIESVAKANVSATNEEIDPEVEAIMQLDASGDKVPVPEGYVGSKAKGENEIDTGYVIYEGTEEVTDSNVEQAKTTRNQYVWIPVPDASKMYGTDSNGKKWGKLYDFATSSTDENYDELTGAYPLNWSETNGVMNISSNTGSMEPRITDNSDYTLKEFVLGVDSKHEFLMQLEKEFNNMIKSVEKYGGFYIGRYETVRLGSIWTPIGLTWSYSGVVKGKASMDNVSWYSMYQFCKELKRGNNKVDTGLIWGSQWDRTLMWLVESKNLTKDTLFTAKQQRLYVANIFELFSNCLEWTMEGTINTRILRAGKIENNFFNPSIAYSSLITRNGYPTFKGSRYLGGRATLYIKP